MPEADLLLALARGDAAAAERVSASWDPLHLLALANRHEIASLCWWMLAHHLPADQKMRSSLVPPELLHALKTAYAHHLVRNEHLLRDLHDVSRALRIHEVDWLVYKGPWLAWHAYPDPATRPIHDIDLGIHEAQYQAAVRALEDVGYRSASPLPATPHEALRRSHYGQQIRFTAPRRRALEMHFRLVNLGPPTPREDWVWQTARTVSVGGVTVRVPGPVAMMLHLILHVKQHGFAVLRLLHDLRWALNADADLLDASQLHARVRALGCTAGAYQTLELAHDLASAAVPVELMRALRPPGLRRRLFATVWRVDAARRLRKKRLPLELESPLLYLLEMGSPRDKLRYAWNVVAESGGPRRLAGKLRRLARGSSE
jgi:hypothetical protein